MSDPTVNVADKAQATLGGVFPILRVADLDASVSYYETQLGFEVQWRSEPNRAPASALHPYGASEVVVTEGAARALLRGRDPYSMRFASPERDRLQEEFV